MGERDARLQCQEDFKYMKIQEEYLKMTRKRARQRKIMVTKAILGRLSARQTPPLASGIAAGRT